MKVGVIRILAAFLLAGAGAAPGAVRFVTPDGAGSRTGADWANASSNIQHIFK